MRKPRVNNQITEREIRVIGKEGENLGVLSLEESLQYAKECGLDLIEISRNSNPPVCKVMDLGKYMYQEEKKAKKKRKGAKIGKLKNIRISLRISEHDLETKINQTKKFLEKGYKARIEVFLRGREKALSNLAREKLETVFGNINTKMPLKKEGEIKRNPRGMEIIISKK
ncbi:MAG: translation initiation factor IF-3 [Candidatus Pacebacteria bacterium]|nr:translation initiation factor IF-3 [Candidatus Paceibacterota bacterium]